MEKRIILIQSNRPTTIDRLTCFLLEKGHNTERGKIKSLFSWQCCITYGKTISDTLEALGWELLLRAAYSSDLAPSDCHLFASIGYTLAERRFGSYEDVKKWLDEKLSAKGEDFYWVVIFSKCPKDVKSVQQAMEHTLNKAFSSFFRI